MSCKSMLLEKLLAGESVYAAAAEAELGYSRQQISIQLRGLLQKGIVSRRDGISGSSRIEHEYQLHSREKAEFELQGESRYKHGKATGEKRSRAFGPLLAAWGMPV